MGRPANEAVAGDVEKLTERYTLAKETKDEAFASLRELLKFPEPTAVHVPIPEDIGAKREVKFDHERLGSKVVKVPEGVVGSWATSLYPSCDYTIAEKKALHDYSVTYDDFVNVEAEVRSGKERSVRIEVMVPKYTQLSCVQLLTTLLRSSYSMLRKS